MNEFCSGLNSPSLSPSVLCVKEKLISGNFSKAQLAYRKGHGTQMWPTCGYGHAKEIRCVPLICRDRAETASTQKNEAGPSQHTAYILYWTKRWQGNSQFPLTFAQKERAKSVFVPAECKENVSKKVVPCVTGVAFLGSHLALARDSNLFIPFGTATTLQGTITRNNVN